MRILTEEASLKGRDVFVHLVHPFVHLVNPFVHLRSLRVDLPLIISDLNHSPFLVITEDPTQRRRAMAEIKWGILRELCAFEYAFTYASNGPFVNRLFVLNLKDSDVLSCAAKAPEIETITFAAVFAVFI